MTNLEYLIKCDKLAAFLDDLTSFDETDMDKYTIPSVDTRSYGEDVAAWLNSEHKECPDILVRLGDVMNLIRTYVGNSTTIYNLEQKLLSTVNQKLTNFEWLVANNKLTDFIDHLYFDSFMESIADSTSVKQYNITITGKRHSQEEVQCVADWLCAPHSEVDND